MVGCLRENADRDDDRYRRIYRNRDKQAIEESELSKGEKRANGLRKS